MARVGRQWSKWWPTTQEGPWGGEWELQSIDFYKEEGYVLERWVCIKAGISRAHVEDKVEYYLNIAIKALKKAGSKKLTNKGLRNLSRAKALKALRKVSKYTKLLKSTVKKW